MEQNTLSTEFPKLKDWTLEKVRQEMSCPNIVLERKFDGTAAILDCFPDSSTIIWGRGILQDETRQIYTENFPEIAEFIDIQVEGRARILGELVVFKDYIGTGGDMQKQIAVFIFKFKMVLIF